MKIYFILALILLVHQSSFAAINNSFTIFGTQFNWAVENKKADKKISAVLVKEKAQSASYDPDCYYSHNDPCKVSQSNTTKKMDKLAEDYKAETDGAFEVTFLKEDKKFRDYGGFVQGYILDELKKKLSGNYLLDFAGDIFISGEFPEAPELSIGVPGYDNITYTKVKMKSGWMTGSSSPAAGSKIRVPKGWAKDDFKYEFKKIVLFAKPTFEGGRLDAWDTALIVGGKKLLAKLEADSKYKGQWAYVYFGDDLKPVCSANIICEFSDEYKNNYIKIDWK